MKLKEAHEISYANGDDAGEKRKKILPKISRVVFYGTGLIFLIWWLYAHLEDIWILIAVTAEAPPTLGIFYGLLGLSVLIVLGGLMHSMAFKNKKN